MKQQFNLKIAEPCQEKFASFQPTQAGGFCQSCQKEVIDFTKMSDKELIDYFKNAPQNTCGHFATSQLKTYTIPKLTSKKHKLGWLSAGLLSLSIFSILPTGNVQAQQKQEVTPLTQAQQPTTPEHSYLTYKTITGTIIDATDGSPLPGVNVVIKGTTQGTVSDIDGKFQLKVEENSILIISYIGYINQEVNSNGSLDIQLIQDEVQLDGAVQVEHVYSSKRSVWQRFKALFRKKN